MNNARRYFAVDGRENWAGVLEFSKAYKSWESNAERITAVDDGIFENYSYHPGSWVQPYREDPESDERRAQRERELDEYLANRPLHTRVSVERYASDLGLVPLGPRLYSEQGVEISQQLLRSRALAGELGEFILYENRILVRREEVELDIERQKEAKRIYEQIRANEPQYSGGWSFREDGSFDFWQSLRQPPPSIKCNCWSKPEGYCGHDIRALMYRGLTYSEAIKRLEEREPPHCGYDVCRSRIREGSGYCGIHKRMMDIRALKDSGMTQAEAVKYLKAKADSQT